MNYIFLDIDGVMNNQKDWLWKVKNDMEQFKRHCMFCDEAWGMLANVCQITGAKVILSSSWRSDLVEIHEEGCVPQFQPSRENYYDAAMLLRYFDHYGIELVGMTKSHYTLRGLEIAEYIGGHLKYGDKWVVIDDEANGIEGIIPSWGLFVKTEFKTGLLTEHCEEIIRYFKGE